MNDLIYQFRYALPVWAVGVLTDWLPENRATQRLRGELLRRVIGSGAGLKVARHVKLIAVNKLSLGRNVYLGPECWINAAGGLTIDDEVMLGPHVCIATTEHKFLDGSVSRGGIDVAPVHIGRGTWLAAHVVVAAGSAVGPGCVVGANSTVTRDLPANVVAGGVPARVIAPRSDGVGAYTRRADIDREGDTR